MTMLCVRRWSYAGQGHQVLANTMVRAQNRAAKGSTKTTHFAHLGILFIYGPLDLHLNAEEATGFSTVYISRSKCDGLINTASCGTLNAHK